jgi:hypothetical protein
MYQWYSNATLCYIHLEDLPPGGRAGEGLPNCRWLLGVGLSRNCSHRDIYVSTTCNGFIEGQSSLSWILLRIVQGFLMTFYLELNLFPVVLLHTECPGRLGADAMGLSPGT